MLDLLKYPIGKYSPVSDIDQTTRAEWIAAIAALPTELTAAVQGLDNKQLDTPYRDGGWTVRQLIHHIADSHMNSQIRFRWALTEDVPLIKVYDEKLWAELPDARTLPVQTSLDLIQDLHARWVALLTQMPEADFKRKLRHPVSGECSLDWMLGLYAWHGHHHTAHILNLRQRMTW